MVTAIVGAAFPQRGARAQPQTARLLSSPSPTALGWGFAGIDLVSSLFFKALKKGLGDQGTQDMINLCSETAESR
jgi:alpha-D-ribose 1-methylphosphonate 5-phosphate C-P lyase